MSFWWASQNSNYKTAIPSGTLWTRPRIDGVLPRNRELLQQLAVDDVVIHYGAPFVRAVSRVVASALQWPRPPEYPRGPRETESNDDGMLVRVEVIASRLAFHRDQVAGLISWGVPGPLAKTGIPREAYISPLSESDGDTLLAALSVQKPQYSLPARPHENWTSGSGATDAQVLAKIRTEQSHLRATLLDGRVEAPCAICARDVPAEMLVAGHIVPRAELSDAERRQYKSIAMLVCVLGCDALFEHGYVVVDGSGLVTRGRATDSLVVADEIGNRVGILSPAWQLSTASRFEQHAATHLPSNEQ